MNLVVLTPGKEVYNGEVSAIKVPGASGEFEVRNNHAAIVSSLTEGTVRITVSDGNKIAFNIENGFIEVLRNEVSVLVQGYSE